MTKKIKNLILITFIIFSSCDKKSEQIIKIYETSRSGNKLTEITKFDQLKETSTITLNLKKKYQTITGFGGAFTESSAYLLNKLSQKNRDTILRAYFLIYLVCCIIYTIAKWKILAY